MRLNRRMQVYLDELARREVSADDHAGVGAVEIQPAGEIFLLKAFLAHPPAIVVPSFEDRTGLECFANRIRMTDLVGEKLARGFPLLLLVTGLLVARRIAEELLRYPGRFNVIVSFDGDDCTVRFHKIRRGERWLLDDLEKYDDEGVMVIEIDRTAKAA